MGSIMTEVFHTPWTSTMVDARAHRHSSSSHQQPQPPQQQHRTSEDSSRTRAATHTPTSSTASSRDSSPPSQRTSAPVHERRPSANAVAAMGTWQATSNINAPPAAAAAAATAAAASSQSPAPPQSEDAIMTRDGPPSPALEPTTQGPTEAVGTQCQHSSPDPMNSTASVAEDGSSMSHSPGIAPHRASSAGSPRRIAVQSLQHIQDIAANDPSLFTSPPVAIQDDDGQAVGATQYMISDMPVGDIIEMVAGLLTKITTTNDQHYEHLHRSIPPAETAGHLSEQTSSVLAFHGKNVPSITILSYLGRIQKYCPATYEVFLSLLVYFDRMTERVNAGQMQSLRQANDESLDRHRSRARDVPHRAGHDAASGGPTPPSSNPLSPHLQRQRRPEGATSTTSPIVGPAATHQQSEPPSPPLSDCNDPANLSHFFVVDSYNIHRLVIAGVTCAAKFFSDVFFTNSRYAKVGGLPLIELNHLELQFLLLNDFRLAIPVEELDQYATMLVAFYAREVVAQRQINGAMEGVESTGTNTGLATGADDSSR